MPVKAAPLLRSMRISMIAASLCKSRLLPGISTADHGIVFQERRHPFWGMDPVEMPPGTHMAKTPEYFGGGAAAWHEVIISSALYNAISKHKLKGACFEVVAEQGQPRVDI